MIPQLRRIEPGLIIKSGRRGGRDRNRKELQRRTFILEQVQGVYYLEKPRRPGIIRGFLFTFKNQEFYQDLRYLPMLIFLFSFKTGHMIKIEF